MRCPANGTTSRGVVSASFLSNCTSLISTPRGCVSVIPIDLTLGCFFDFGSSSRSLCDIEQQAGHHKCAENPALIGNPANTITEFAEMSAFSENIGTSSLRNCKLFQQLPTA